MAGDWIKFRSSLFTHPKVVRMSSALKADTLRTVGGLLSVWCLFDTHSIDGKLEGYTSKIIDDHLRWEGFCEQMKAIGWLEENDEFVILPRFAVHNGQSAKRRAQDADRKKEVRKMSAFDSDKNRTREEKRREDKNPHTPNAGFDAFWTAYPNKTGKGAAEKAWDKIKRPSETINLILAALDRQKQSPQWTKDNGQFIPNPATWLNQRRWEDGEAEQAMTPEQRQAEFMRKHAGI